MTVEDKLEALADSLGWRFINARRDYQNLTQISNFIADTMEGYGIGETFLFLDPVIRDGKNSGYIGYSGNFMVLTKSDLDETTYAERKQKYINPITDILFNSFYNNLRCDFTIKEWRAIEVINVFDFNGDGLSIKFNIEG